MNPSNLQKNKAEQNKLLGIELWKQVNQVVLLDEQMRVKDKRYQGLLNRLREGNCNDSDVEMLNNRVIGNFPGIINTITNNRIITPGNELVMEINKLFASHHSQYHRVLVTTAKDTIRKKKLSSDFSKKIRDYPSTWTKGLPENFQCMLECQSF